MPNLKAVLIALSIMARVGAVAIDTWVNPHNAMKNGFYSPVAVGMIEGLMVEANTTDGFWLYDLTVETVVGDRVAVCRHIEGEQFRVEGELLIFDDQPRVSMYALAALLPLLPAKQRVTDAHDWMSTDAEIACPDPNCGGRFRITRGQKRWFSHAETTGLPEARDTPYWQKGEVT